MSHASRIRAAVAGLLGVLLLAPSALGQGFFPGSDEIRRRLDERLARGGGVGVVVGLLEADGTRRFVAAGSSGNGVPLDEHALFEIGSVTKPFTATFLADMVARGEVSSTTRSRNTSRRERASRSGTAGRSPWRRSRRTPRAPAESDEPEARRPEGPVRGLRPRPALRVPRHLRAAARPGRIVVLLERRLRPSRSRARKARRHDVREAPRRARARPSRDDGDVGRPRSRAPEEGGPGP